MTNVVGLRRKDEKSVTFETHRKDLEGRGATNHLFGKKTSQERPDLEESSIGGREREMNSFEDPYPQFTPKHLKNEAPFSSSRNRRKGKN